MKTHYIEEMIGKTISSVILRARENSSPHCQLLISFEEGNNFEFYSMRDMIFCAKGSWPWDALEKTLKDEDAVDVARIGHTAQGENRSSKQKISLALKKAREIKRCFNNYDDTSVAGGLNELIEFLEGEKEDLSFKTEFKTYRNRSEGLE